MSDLEIYRLARHFFEESAAVEQVLKRFPANTQVGVLLDGRFEGHLLYDGSTARFGEGPASNADFELQIGTEALRRMANNPPDSIGMLAKEFLSQGLRREIKWRVLTPPKSLYEKGYGQTMKDLGPLLQGEAAQSLMIHAGKALAVIEELKAKFRPKS